MYQRAMTEPCLLSEFEEQGNDRLQDRVDAEEEDREDRRHDHHHHAGHDRLATRRPRDLRGLVADLLDEFEWGRFRHDVLRTRLLRN